MSSEMKAKLASLARIDTLGADDEVSGFGAALVVEGSVAVCATIMDEPVARAEVGTLVPTRGTFAAAMPLRVVAGQGGARVALWDQPALEDALRACPWVIEELAGHADRLQALAGAAMGPLGELDEAVRVEVLGRLEVRIVRPQEAPRVDEPVALVCVGSVEANVNGKPEILRGGEILFPRADPEGAKAGAQGAILLVGEAPTAAELAPSPSLAALFAPR